MNPTLELDPAAAKDHHILVTPAGVDMQQFSALLASRFDTVLTQDEYTRAVSAHTSFSGPYSLTAATRNALGLPAWAEMAYTAHVPAQRGGPLPPELHGVDPVWDAFAAGQAEGDEALAVAFLCAAARKVGGGVVVNECAIIPQPTADLTLFSPVWLDPQALDTLVAPFLGERSSSLADAEHYRLPDDAPLTGYSIYGAGAGGMVSVAVEAEEYLPAAVAAHEWARDGVVSYQIRWNNDDGASLNQPSFCSEAAALVEGIVRALQDLAPGVVCDDDGFLIDLN